MTSQEPGARSQPVPPIAQQPQSTTVTPDSPAPAAVGARKRRNNLALAAFIVSIIGFVFACIPGALIVGWILLPIAFILAIVSLFMKGTGKGLGIAGLIISIVGTVVAVVVFLSVVATSFEDAFGGTESTVEPSEDASDEGDAAAEETPAAAVEGTRENPVTVGSTISSDDWTVVVNSYTTDGNPVVALEQYNEAAPAGSHYEIVNYTVTYTGAESAMALEVGVDVVTTAGNVINSYDNFAILDDALGIDELFTGASATGSAAFIVPDGETVNIRVRPGVIADEVFVKP